MSETSITRKMISLMNEARHKPSLDVSELGGEQVEKDNFLTEAKILMQEAVGDKKKINEEDLGNHAKYDVIKKDTPQFGDVVTSQEEAIRKAVNDNVTFEEDALRYYPEADDMTIDGKIPSMNMNFQFRYSDPSSEGCYIFCNGTQLTDANARMIGKVRDAYLNWKDSITQDGDLLNKLKKSSQR